MFIFEIKECCMKRIAFIILFKLIVSAAFADIRLPAVIGNNMVLEQNALVTLLGWGDASEKIYITPSWNNKTDSTISTRDAKWDIKIQTPAAGGPYSIIIKGNNTINLTNVMIGEVWVCSGQSNMEFHHFYQGSKDIEPEFKILQIIIFISFSYQELLHNIRRKIVMRNGKFAIRIQ
jgi:sialate O-acetylesterase